MLQFIDTHIHLQDFKADFAPPVLNCADAKRMITVSTREADYDKIADLMQKYPEKIIGAFGVHPWYAKENFDADKLSDMLKKFPQALVGEIGVDELKEKVSAEQHEIFSLQLKAAKEFGRPVLVHAAKAFEALTIHETELKKVKYVYHGYVKNFELLKFIIRTGGYVGLGRLFLKQTKAKALWQEMPKDRILFETDAPYQFNEDGYLESVQENLTALADIAEMSAPELAEMLVANSERFLK